LHSGGQEVDVTRLALAAAALVTVVAAPAAQQSVPPLPSAQQPPSSVFRSGTSLVALNVTVTDGREFVSGLEAGDFAVYEDGVQQPLTFFEAREVPLDLMLLLDTSSSMRDKMEVVQQAALGFMKTLGEGDRGAVVAFNDGVSVVQDLTTDKEAIEAAIRRTQAKGGTALHNAIYITMKQFGRAAQDTGDVRRQAIAVLSDGADTTSMLSFDDVLAQARRSGVSIYTIGLKSPYQLTGPAGPHDFSESDYALKTLAQDTGGQSFFPGQVGDLRGIYASIAAELSSQYSIGYAPVNPRADGRFRRIVVRVVSRPELKPRARTGYLADRRVSNSAGLDHQPR
jgi:Ca-activated chloride channel family protein